MDKRPRCLIPGYANPTHNYDSIISLCYNSLAFKAIQLEDSPMFGVDRAITDMDGHSFETKPLAFTSGITTDKEFYLNLLKPGWNMGRKAHHCYFTLKKGTKEARAIQRSLLPQVKKLWQKKNNRLQQLLLKYQTQRTWMK